MNGRVRAFVKRINKELIFIRGFPSRFSRFISGTSIYIFILDSSIAKQTTYMHVTNNQAELVLSGVEKRGQVALSSATCRVF